MIMIAHQTEGKKFDAIYSFCSRKNPQEELTITIIPKNILLIHPPIKYMIVSIPRKWSRLSWHIPSSFWYTRARSPHLRSPRFRLLHNKTTEGSIFLQRIFM